MPEPRTVWAVGLRGPEPVEGTLSLASEGVRFAPPDGGTLHVAPPRIRSTRRLLASPALKLIYLSETGLRELFFFFVKPPPMPEAPRVPGLSMRGAQRTAGAFTLRSQSKEARAEIAEWVEEIRGLARR